MNPRVVLLFSIAALFIAMWSMDSQHQTAVMLSRKAKQQATMAQTRHDRTAVTLLSIEGRRPQHCTDELTFAEHVSETQVVNQTVIGWDCLPKPGIAEPNIESTAQIQLSVETILISNESQITEDEVVTEEPNDAEFDNSNYECSKSNRCRDEVSMTNLWSFGGIDIALPEEITAGEYRIVSDRGDIRSLTLLPAELSYNAVSAESTPRDLYNMELEGVRWYFIRINPASVLVQTAKTATDWQPTATAITAWFNSDLRLTVWRMGSRLDRIQRQANAIGRQSQTWSSTMSQALHHAIRVMESAKRFSAEDASLNIRL